MTAQVQNLGVEEFLNITFGSKEVGLMIAQDSHELESFISSAEGFGFKRFRGLPDLFELSKIYVVADESLEKDVYDFIVQYPTGQIEIFDSKISQSRTLSPDYNNSAIVVIVLKESLNKLEAKGFDLLASVGPAFQTN
jgi:hypothetical protein